MEITTRAKVGMSLADAMDIVREVAAKHFDSDARFRVGVDGNDNIVLATGGGLRFCDIGFTLSQVCKPA